jgi:hypothetical protein
MEVPDVDAKGNISGNSVNPSKFTAGKIYMSNSSNTWDIVTSYDNYTINANANGGTINGYSTAEFKYILRTGQVVSLTSIPVTDPIKEHYEFTGWYTDAACTPNSLKSTNRLIAMYHDVGLAPLKALYFDRSINVSLNLPIIRTSVDHGTAFDIAYQSKASIESYIESIKFAINSVKIQA